MKRTQFLRTAATATIRPGQVNHGFFLKQERLVIQFHCLQDNDTYSYTIYGHPALRSDWNDVILSPIPSGKPTQKMTYLIRGLEPSSQYEARVEAKNRFGWSRSSDSFTFYTTGMGESQDSAGSLCTHICVLACNCRSVNMLQDYRYPFCWTELQPWYVNGHTLRQAAIVTFLSLNVFSHHC
jgi:hypothetical protein